MTDLNSSNLEGEIEINIDPSNKTKQSPSQNTFPSFGSG